MEQDAQEASSDRTGSVSGLQDKEIRGVGVIAAPFMLYDCKGAYHQSEF